jgi:nitrogen regulatory protein P-II 1
MKKIIAIIRPMMLEPVKAALADDTGVCGITVTDVRGCGQPGADRFGGTFRGQEYILTLEPKVKLEMTVTDELEENVVETILTYAHTGNPGDGKIFVIPMGDAIRIRTGDIGDAAVQ